MKKILSNYKTTIPAVLILLSVALYWTGYISKEQLETGIALFASLGFFGAKDYSNDKNN